jgi:DNA-binding GntR family transcriptional regulator
MLPASEAAGNDILSRELWRLQTRADLIRVFSRQRTGDHIRLSQREHWMVVEALENRDAGAARRALEGHIRQASQHIVRLIDVDVPHTLADGVAAGAMDSRQRTAWTAHGMTAEDE